MQGDGDVVPGRTHEVVAEQRLWSEADGVQNAVDASPVFGHGAAHGLGVGVIGDVEFEDGNVVTAGQLARRPLGEAEPASGSREHQVGTLLTGHRGDGVRQRCVGQHARDHDVLAVEEAHRLRP